MKPPFSRHLLGIWLILFCVAARGTERQDEPSRALKLKDFQYLSGHFRQKKDLKELELTLQTEGRFDINRFAPKSSLIHWNIEKPKTSKICMDESGLVMDSGEKNQPVKKVSFSDMGEKASDQMTGFFHLLTLSPKDLNENFEVSQVASSFELRPKNLQKSLFNKIDLWIDSEGLVRKIEIFEKSNDKIEIEFSDMKIGEVKKDHKCLR